VSTVVHTGPKANTNKTQTSRFTWFPKTGYVHGDSRLYIIWGMIQTLNSTQYNPIKSSVSLLHSVFLSNLHFLTLPVALTLTAYFFYTYTHCTLYLHLYKKEEPWQQPMCSLINANQLLQEESHGGWKKVDKFVNIDNLLHPHRQTIFLSYLFLIFCKELGLLIKLQVPSNKNWVQQLEFASQRSD